MLTGTREELLIPLVGLLFISPNVLMCGFLPVIMCSLSNYVIPVFLFIFAISGDFLPVTLYWFSVLGGC